MKIFVGNLPFDVSEAEVRQMFEAHGAVESANVVTDSMTGRSRGFAFVEMSDADANKAIAALNGTDLRGRNLNVNEARPKRDFGGGGGGRGRGGDRGHGGNRGGGGRQPRW